MSITATQLLPVPVALRLFTEAGGRGAPWWPWGLLHVHSTGIQSLPPKGVTHEENYVTRFTLLPFNVEHVEQCIGL